MGWGRFKSLEPIFTTQINTRQLKSHNFDFGIDCHVDRCFNRNKSGKRWDRHEVFTGERGLDYWALDFSLCAGVYTNEWEEFSLFSLFLLHPPAGIVLYRIYKVLLLLLLCVTMCVCVQYYPSCCCCSVQFVCDISALALTKNGRSFKHFSNRIDSASLDSLNLRIVCCCCFFSSSSFFIFQRKTKMRSIKRLMIELL